MPKLRSQTTISSTTTNNPTSRHRDTLSKPNATSDNEDIIPIPIQIFLWRQSKLVDRFSKERTIDLLIYSV